MTFTKRKPSPDDKRRLPGKSNVEALLVAVDARLTKPASIVLVGRASYEIGNPDFLSAMRSALGERERRSDITGKLILTDDVDAYYSDDAEEVVAIAHQSSFVAELADCYFHALNEQTLVLPKEWKDRVVKIPGMERLENLHLYRLDPLDFIACKASAGRDKDWQFLSAFIRISPVEPATVVGKIDEVLNDPTQRLRNDPTAQFALASFRDRVKKEFMGGAGGVDLPEQRALGGSESPHDKKPQTEKQ